MIKLKDNGNLPNSDKTAKFVVLECTPNMDLQNLRCNTYLMQSVSFRDPMGCMYIAGADPGFQVRGGGGTLKKIAPSGGGREHFWVFRVKNHDFTPKNHIFFQF